MKDVALAISDEMGAPMKFALNAQAGSGLGHFMSTLAALKEFEFEETSGHHADSSRAGRRVRLDHAVELAAQSDRLQSRARARCGLHDGAQAQRSRAAQRAHLRRDHAEAGVPERRVQSWSTAMARPSAKRCHATRTST